MAPKWNRLKIEAFRRKLIDDPTDDDRSSDEQTQLSWSVEIYNTKPNLEVPYPQTRAEARVGQSQAQKDSPSQSHEEGSEETACSMPQMTISREEQSSEWASEDRGYFESSVTPSSSLAPDASTPRWWS